MATPICRLIATGLPLPEKIRVSSPGRSHSHPMREIFFQLQGEVRYMLDGNYYRIKAGDAVFIDSRQEHGIYFFSEERNVRQLWIWLERKEIRTVVISLDDRGEIGYDFFYTGGVSPVLQALQSNWDAVSSGEIRSPLWQKYTLQASLELLLCDVARSMMNEEFFQSYKQNENVIEFLKNYIDGNHGCNCSLARLEKLTGYSRYHLSHLYRDCCGKTIGNAVNEARMRYLVRENWSVGAKEVAEKLGFASVATFRRWKRLNRELEMVIRHQQHSAESEAKEKEN